MNARRHLLARITVVLVCACAISGLAQIPSARLPKPDSPRAEVAVTDVGELEISADSGRQGEVHFVHPREFIQGDVFGLTDRGFVQLVARTPKGAWRVTQGFARTNPMETAWRIPAASVGCTDSSGVIEIRAVLTHDLLSIGADDPISLDRIRASSSPILISCQHFDRGRLEIAEVAWRTPKRRAPIHVSEIEPVRIRCEGLPPGALVQVVVESMNLKSRWVMDDATTACSGGPREITTSAYFGRTLALGTGQVIDLDLNTNFALYAVATTKRLPVYQEHRIEPEEWNALSHFIQAQSPRAYVDRTVLGNAVRLRIDELGWSNDQEKFIAAPYESVSGRFETGKHYVTPSTPETVALLVRSSDEGAWRVAGQTQLLRNRGEWTIHVARLAENSGDTGKLFIAIAAAFPRPLEASHAVPDSVLDAALGISEEVSFRIVPRR